MSIGGAVRDGVCGGRRAHVIDLDVGFSLDCLDFWFLFFSFLFYLIYLSSFFGVETGTRTAAEMSLARESAEQLAEDMGRPPRSLGTWMRLGQRADICLGPFHCASPDCRVSNLKTQQSLMMGQGSRLGGDMGLLWGIPLSSAGLGVMGSRRGMSIYLFRSLCPPHRVNPVTAHSFFFS
jgi:hypothetical protein